MKTTRNENHQTQKYRKHDSIQVHVYSQYSNSLFAHTKVIGCIHYTNSLTNNTMIYYM